jgi:hypothetical protein
MFDISEEDSDEYYNLTKFTLSLKCNTNYLKRRKALPPAVYVVLDSHTLGKRTFSDEEGTNTRRDDWGTAGEECELARRRDFVESAGQREQREHGNSSFNSPVNESGYIG